MKKSTLPFFLLLSLPFCHTYSQNSLPEDSTDLMYYDNAERLLQDTDTDAEDSDIMDYLDDLRRNPIDLNTADADLLMAVPYITKELAAGIIGHRNKSPGFSSKRELLMIEGFSGSLYDLVSPYFIAKRLSTNKKKETETPGHFKSLSADFRSLAVQDLQTKKGFVEEVYAGSKSRISGRLRVKYDANAYSVKAAIATDKDPGETSYTDFISGFVSFEGKGFLRNLTLGNYQLSFGNGLTLSSSYSVPKGLEPAMRTAGKSVLRPYSSTGESVYMSGAVSNLRASYFDLYLFLSRRNLDASIDTISNEVKSIYTGGYHRSLAEVGRKNTLKEVLYGIRTEYNLLKFGAGATYYAVKYSPGIKNDTVKKLYGLNGSNLQYAGIDFRYSFKSGGVFGEATMSHNGAIAFYGGMKFASGKTAEAVFSYRNYPYGFYSPYSNAMSERSYSQNESGFFAGLILSPFKRIRISSYIDQYSFPYRTYFNPLPARGRDIAVNCEVSLNSGFILNLRYKNEMKEEQVKFYDTEQRVISEIGSRNQTSIRAGFIFGKKDFQIKSRFEYNIVRYNGLLPAVKGNLFYADVKTAAFGFLDLSARVIFFHTDNYDSRVYEFENDVGGLMTNPGLYGKGMRYYLLISSNISSAVKIETKYSETGYSGVKKIGSSNDEVSGDTLNRIALSILAKF
jgi:hypothetical protein